MKALRDKKKIKLKGGGKLDMKALDADRNGKLSLAEFVAAGGTACTKHSKHNHRHPSVGSRAASLATHWKAFSQIGATLGITP